MLAVQIDKVPHWLRIFFSLQKLITRGECVNGGQEVRFRESTSYTRVVNSHLKSFSVFLRFYKIICLSQITSYFSGTPG